MISSRGYPIEIHQVTTEDGYILQLHRIPNSIRRKVSQPSGQRKVVYLQHGMMSSDHIWIINPTDKALAYILADRGYDVWLANSRGTPASRRHVTIDSSESQYWQYS